MHLNDIIIAIASPPGRSKRGIIRLSGHQTFVLLGHLLTDCPSSIRRGVTRHVLHLADDLPLPVLVFSMPGPHSYTGEDSCEIQCPGNPILLERLIELLLERGREFDIHARRAEPGEFTARAYFNGRLTLDKAEGVAATIAARSDAELRASHQLLEGRLGSFATQQMDRLAQTLGLVEAGIDFTDEEDVIAITPGDLCEQLEHITEALGSQLQHSIGMEQLEAVPWVVLVGEPNAGKSTLFNALLGTDRAVTSAVAGTTRDVLVEPLTLHTSSGPAEVMLVDLAGLDDIDHCEVNRHMQEAARDAIRRAELLLRCIAVHDDARHLSLEAGDDVNPTPTIVTHTKCDLSVCVAHETPCDQGVRVSAECGIGVDELRKRIAEHLAGRLVSVSADMLALQPRHEAALQSARACLQEALEVIEPCRSQRVLRDPEIVAALLRRGLDALGLIVGEMTPDDVLGLVFGRFCIGK